ncbi:MAG TPA: hypothetical protein EYP29_00415, partial [Thermoplasmata archaeon]|nr:hypothetical protein [Thermoplasmata archaeon]
MKKIRTTCPHCQREMEIKLFGFESSQTHSVKCKFCQRSFSIDNEGKVVKIEEKKGSESEFIKKLEDEIKKKLAEKQDIKRKKELMDKTERARSSEPSFRIPEKRREPHPYPFPPAYIKIKKKAPLREKIFYGLSGMVIFLFFIFAAVYYSLPRLETSWDRMEISGKVKEESGQPVKNAVVLIDDTNISNVTNSEGYFRLDNVERGKHTIVVKAEGYGNFSFTTFIFGMGLEDDGTEEFNFKISKENVEIDKTEDIKRRANFTSAVSIFYLVLVLVAIFYVHRKESFIKTGGFFLFCILLSFIFMGLGYGYLVSPFAFLYFVLATLFLLSLKKEFEIQKRLKMEGMVPQQYSYFMSSLYEYLRRKQMEMERG